MGQDRRGAAGRLLMEMFRREFHPNGFPADMTENELFAGFDAWLQQQSGNETVQTLRHQMEIDYHLEMMEETLSSPEGKAAGFRSAMRPNADGTVTQLWTNHMPDEAPLEPNAKDPARN